MYSRDETETLRLANELLQQLASQAPQALSQAILAIGSDNEKSGVALDQLALMSKAAQEVYRVA